MSQASFWVVPNFKSNHSFFSKVLSECKLDKTFTSARCLWSRKFVLDTTIDVRSKTQILCLFIECEPKNNPDCWFICSTVSYSYSKMIKTLQHSCHTVHFINSNLALNASELLRCILNNKILWNTSASKVNVLLAWNWIQIIILHSCFVCESTLCKQTIHHSWKVQQ